MNWWYEITKTEQVLYIVASIATAILAIHTIAFLRKYKKEKSVTQEKILSLVFSLRSLLVLLSVGGWITIISYKAIEKFPVSFVIGAFAGICVAVLLAFCLMYVIKLEGLPDVDLNKTIGLRGEVYSAVPPKGEGRGKVSISFDGKMRVFEAVAYEDNKINSGNDIRVVDALGSGLLLVESVQEEI